MTNQYPKQVARDRIDELLGTAGWSVQDAKDANMSAANGVTIRELPLTHGHGAADYLLYVKGRAARVIEANKQHARLIGIEPQSFKYADGLPNTLPA